MMQLSAGYQLMFGTWCTGVAMAAAVPVVVVATPVIVAGLAAAAVASAITPQGSGRYE